MRAIFSRTTFGWLLIVIGGFFFVGSMVDLDDGWSPGDTALWWLVVFLPLAGGVALVTTGLRASLQRRRDALEHRIFALAQAHGGAITAADLAGATALTLDQSQSSLSRLAARGHVTSELRDDGTLVYRVPSAASGAMPPRVPETTDGAVTVTQSLDEMARQRRAATAIALSFLASLLALSLMLTVAGPFLWPATG